MFKCARCDALTEEVRHLREINSKLVDRLVAMSDIKAFGAVHHTAYNNEGYYGSGEDDQIEFNELGAIVVKKT